MDDGFRQAFTQQARKRLKLDRAVLARHGNEPGSLAMTLERAGLIDAAGWRAVYAGVREKVLSRNVQHHRDASDRALLRLAVRCGIVSGEQAGKSLASWNERPARARPRLSQDLVDTGTMTSAQRDELARRLAAEQVACAICGLHLDKLALTPGLCCPRCGWPELAPERGAPAVSSATWTGRVVGGWTLVERAGQGALGRVFYARHPDHGEGAFKVLNPQAAADPRWLARFEREARAAAAVDHPGVVRILDVGKDEELPFLVMEWVDGESLAQLLDRSGPLEVAHAVQIARRLAGALAAAHGAGIIHRDIKPANVLLDRQSRAKLADFGLARGVVDASVSQAGAVLGSPGYMSPEQVQGQPVDFRCDVFALGLVIHAMVAGKSPLSRPSAMDSLRATVNERVPPLSRAVPSVPPLLDALVLEMTSRDLERRTGTMSQVIEGLERIAGGSDPEDRAARGDPLPGPGAADAPRAVAPAGPAAVPAPRIGAPIAAQAAGPLGSPPTPRAGAVRRSAPGELAAAPPARLLATALVAGMALLGWGGFAVFDAVWPARVVVSNAPRDPEPARGSGAAEPATPARPREPAAGSGSPRAAGSEGAVTPVRPVDRFEAEVELARYWPELIDSPGTPTAVRHARWCAIEAKAGPTLRALMQERRQEAFTDLHIQAQNEIERAKPALEEATRLARWDEARQLAASLPAWSTELARTRARMAEYVDAMRYGKAFDQVLTLIRAEPDRARAAVALVSRDEALAAHLARHVQADPTARWIDELARVVEACEVHLDGLEVPCVLAWTATDGAAQRFGLLHRVRPACDETGAPTWGRELVGRLGGKPTVVGWDRVPREQKARWALAELRRREVVAGERRRLVAQYLKAAGVPAPRSAGVVDGE